MLKCLAEQPLADRTEPPDVGGRAGPHATDPAVEVLDDTEALEPGQDTAADAAGRPFSGVIGEVQPQWSVDKLQAAITPAGDHVSIDAHVCAGCGQCAAVCPTGAAAYALPPADTLMRRLRALLGW